MTNEEFKDWRARMGLSIKESAKELGISLRTAQNYNDGRAFIGGGKSRIVKIPHPVYLACLWLEHCKQETSEPPN